MKALDARWREAAACLGADLDWFFSQAGQHGDAARALCRRCPVRSECLEEALSLPSGRDFGIRGGMSKKARDAIRKRRKTERRLSA